MVPLSCLNCCHNPLQLGPIGTAFGFCTRHRVVLNQPHATTCGQLLRKDLLAESAQREQRVHAQSYAKSHVSLLADPTTPAETIGSVEKPNGQLPIDDVLEEVQGYGKLDSKIASMAALHRIPGARAEVAMLSLSRAYFANCLAQDGPWTAGVHLVFWTMKRLDKDPDISATDLRGPIPFSLGDTIAVARWTLVAFRLALISDVGQAARRTDDPAGNLAALPTAALNAVQKIDPDRLLRWLARNRRSWSAALTPARYAELREQLHREDETEHS